MCRHRLLLALIIFKMVKKFNCVCEKGSHYSTNQVKKCRRAHGLDKKAPIISKKKVVS
jgi:hypothetical protein